MPMPAVYVATPIAYATIIDAARCHDEPYALLIFVMLFRAIDATLLRRKRHI